MDAGSTRGRRSALPSAVDHETLKSELPIGLTPKAFVVGALMSLGIGVGTVYGSLILRSSRMAMNFNTPAAVFFFFVLVGIVNVVLGLIRRDFALNRAELLVVYIMMIAATAIPTMGFTEYMIPVISGLFYYATPENDWANQVLPYIQDWMIVENREAVWALFEGLPEGVRIPWGVWLKPLLYWCLFFAGLCFTMICMMVILRKEWVDKERLIYPLVHLPLEMVKDDERNSLIKPFFKNPVMWAGLAIPFAIGSINALHAYHHFIPAITLNTTVSLFRRTISLPLRPSFPLIGFTYLINLDIAFGFWVFHLFGIVQRGVFSMLGIESTEKLCAYVSAGPDLAHQGMGALVVLVAFGLWVSREHLRDVFRKAFRGDAEVDDSDEILPYRAAVLGMIGGVVFIGFWLWKSGLPAVTVPLFLFGTFILYLGLTRVLAQGAVASVMPPLTTMDFVTSGVGTSVLGPQGLAALAFTWAWNTEMRTFIMASSANGLKIAEGIGGKKRLLFGAIVLAILISLIASIGTTLYYPYKYGGINLHRVFFIGQPHFAFNDMARKMMTPSPANLRGWIFTGIGGTAMGLLMWIQRRFLWWPLHPLGFAIGCAGGWIGGVIWFSAFIGWLFKVVILKYGGPRLYRQVRPFFLGLILGQAVVAGTWLVIDSFTGMTDNVIAIF